MELVINAIGGLVHARLSGVVDSAAAGRLYDGLVAGIGSGPKTLVVDVSGVESMTRAGVRGFVVAAKLLQAAGGTMRISGARTEVAATLESLGYSHLIRIDRTVGHAIIAMKSTLPVASLHSSGGSPRDVTPLLLSASPPQGARSRHFVRAR